MARIGFCNSLINYTIVFAGLMIAGFGGLAAAQLPNSALVTAIFLLFGGLAFQVLNMILAREEWLISRVSRRLTDLILLHPSSRSVWFEPKFLFITLFAIALPLFTWGYLYNLKVPQWIYQNPILLVFVVLNGVFFALTIVKRRSVVKSLNQSANEGRRNHDET